MDRRASKPASQRQLRVGEELRHSLSEIFARGDLRDPDLMGRSITVTEVRASPDLRNVTAYVTPLGGVARDARNPKESKEALLAALARSAPFLRARLAEMVPLRYSPKLFFAIDASFEAARRIEEVLREPAVARDLAKKPDDKKPGEE
jgi:ribosome-binding factor A